MLPSLNSFRISRVSRPSRGGFFRFSSRPSSSSTISLTETVSETHTIRDTSNLAPELSDIPSGSNSSPKSRNRDVRVNELMSRMETAAARTVRHRQRLADDREKMSSMGSLQTTLRSSRPSAFAKNPPSSTDLTLSTLIAATAHLGHHKSLTSPTNYPFIYGTRSDLAVLDLRQTLTYLHRACNVIRETVENDGIVLFATGIDGTQHAIKAASERLGKNGYALGHRPNNQNGVWVRGTLTNSTEVLKGPRQVVKQMHLAKSFKEGQGLNQAQNMRKQQSDNLESLKFQPALIVVLSPRDSRVLLREASLKQIPTIGVIDSDVDPRVVTYPIPANDDSIRLIELLAGVLARAGQEGLRRREQKLSRLMLTGSGHEKLHTNTLRM